MDLMTNWFHAAVQKANAKLSPMGDNLVEIIDAALMRKAIALILIVIDHAIRATPIKAQFIALLSFFVIGL